MFYSGYYVNVIKAETELVPVSISQLSYVTGSTYDTKS